jgi:hypothetical protein
MYSGFANVFGFACIQIVDLYEDLAAACGLPFVLANLSS